MKYEKLKNYENIYIFLKYKTMYKKKIVIPTENEFRKIKLILQK